MNTGTSLIEVFLVLNVQSIIVGPDRSKDLSSTRLHLLSLQMGVVMNYVSSSEPPCALYCLVEKTSCLPLSTSSFLVPVEDPHPHLIFVISTLLISFQHSLIITYHISNLQPCGSPASLRLFLSLLASVQPRSITSALPRLKTMPSCSPTAPTSLA